MNAPTRCVARTASFSYSDRTWALSQAGHCRRLRAPENTFRNGWQLQPQCILFTHTDKVSPRSNMKRTQCANATCCCTTAEGQVYCSKYCEQAVEQAVERNYCQCEHACTSTGVTTTYALPTSGIQSQLEPELQPSL